MGLAIVDNLTRRMGGEVGLQSRVNVGTTFWFELPFPLAPPQESTPENPDFQTHEDLQEVSLRVLVAEDNPIIAKLIVKQLQDLGHQPTLTLDGAEALRTLKKTSFDIVLLDARMPRVDGLSAASEIRKTYSSSKLPIVLLTAEAQIEEEAWRKAGIDLCLVKPVSTEALRPVLNRFVPVS